ncbi:large eukaryotic DNA virus major capsid protein-domain-containing protein [Fimicolochytrium jonesii]|uniref:large eukaryotic DNA virus major capsid protein-domain-containing protein n=1 Tax=Fimicolochytrium jonesii TaxID=1396493 RepID=UPI0022FE92DE|nr:large eukaryotic DNA virus major capsid protein-domain-containing protein [Fimicolochytrium jonesii]KAI8822603.1 large eukaryotic DNA virus major capsid protein-domain-containing protein [Fimicolochytrium jonesii]
MFHEVRINFQLATFNELVITGNGIPIANPPSLVNVDLFMTYVYLDGVERKVFAQSSHEYLVQLWQYTGTESVASSNPKIKLTFAHPAKEIIYPASKVANVDNYANRHFDYTDSGTSGDHYNGNDPVVSAKLLLNTTERLSERSSAFFSTLQPYWHHTRCPARGIGLYSFALNPEALQPSGSCNFSRLENVSRSTFLSALVPPLSPSISWPECTTYYVCRAWVVWPTPQPGMWATIPTPQPGMWDLVRETRASWISADSTAPSRCARLFEGIRDMACTYGVVRGVCGVKLIMLGKAALGTFNDTQDATVCELCVSARLHSVLNVLAILFLAHAFPQVCSCAGFGYELLAMVDEIGGLCVVVHGRELVVRRAF